MAAQTVMTLCSSSAPKLATFKSPTPTLCFSSLPTPCLKASYGGIRVLQTAGDFKCYASPSDGAAVHFHPFVSTAGAGRMVKPGGWIDIPDVEHDEEVQALGKFAVEEHNKKEKTDIKFMRVVEAESQVVAGVNYRLWIQGEVDKVDKVYKGLVFVGLPVYPKELESFTSVDWASDPILRKAVLAA